MKTYVPVYFFLTAFILLIQSCGMKNPEERMQKYAGLYENKKISNSLMLFEMGKIFRKYPDNPTVRSEYFQKMIISGYSSHVVHLFLKDQEKKMTEEDMKTVLFALQKGNLFNLAAEFKGRFSNGYEQQLDKMIEVNDSVSHYNNLIKAGRSAEAYEKRGKFFTRLNAADMANLDFDRSIRLDPCNPGTVFEKAMLLFNIENNAEVIKLLESCSKNLKTGDLKWYPVFHALAKELESLKHQAPGKKELLFRQASLYVNNGFPELALRKSDELLKEDENRNPDYLALHGFIYYKMNNKKQALQYVSMAENISGRKSKLSEMIAKME